MTGRTRWKLVPSVCLAMLLLPSAGCMFAADLVNPDLLSTFGFDARAITGEPGTVLVALNNATSFVADMSVVAARDATGTRLLEAGRGNMAAGEVWIASFECPVYSITPGRLTADGGFDDTAITVVGTEGQTNDLTYTGAAPQSDLDYTCGDVIEIRLLQVGEGGAAADFLIQVFVRPGR